MGEWSRRVGHSWDFWPDVSTDLPKSPSRCGLEQKWEMEHEARASIEMLPLVLKMGGWPHDWAFWEVIIDLGWRWADPKSRMGFFWLIRG